MKKREKNSLLRTISHWKAHYTTCSLTVDLSLGWFKFEPSRWRHMWVEFVLGSLSCSKRFFSGTPVFPSPQKTSLPNSNSIWNARTLFNDFLRTPRWSVSKQITWIYKFTIYVEPIKPKRCKGYSKNLLCHSPLLSEGLWLYGRFYTCHLHHYILSRQVVGTPRSLRLANTTSTQHLKLNKVVVNVQNVPLKGIKNGFPQVRCTQSQIS